MTSGLDKDDGIVVVLATGSKELHVAHLSIRDREVIHDCHAEILARRAFVYFLYRYTMSSNVESNSTST